MTGIAVLFETKSLKVITQIEAKKLNKIK